MPGPILHLMETELCNLDEGQKWNEFMFALTLVQSIKKNPLTFGLYNFVGRYTTQWEFLTAAAFLAIIPNIVLFLTIEKELVAGIVGGAVKG